MSIKIKTFYQRWKILNKKYNKKTSKKNKIKKSLWLKLINIIKNLENLKKFKLKVKLNRKKLKNKYLKNLKIVIEDYKVKLI